MKSFKTFSTVLKEDNAKEIIEYFEETAGNYGFLKRCTLHILRNYPEVNRNDLNKLLQERFSVTTRTANSAIYEVEEIISSALALIPLNIEKLETRIDDKIKIIEKKKKEMAKIHVSRKTNTKRLGKLKLHIYNIHNSINRIKQKIENLERQLNEKKPNICMGTKKLARNNMEAFKRHRDSQINYIGSVNIKKMKYPFGKAGTTNAGLADVISKVCEKAIETGKSIIAEDLSFEKKKRKTKKAISLTEKEKMRTLHSLPYSRYAQILENITFNKRIELIKVNPAYTSRTAEQKFCNQMKLNVHNGAAYVIARKGMGIKDKFIAS